MVADVAAFINARRLVVPNGVCSRPGAELSLQVWSLPGRVYILSDSPELDTMHWSSSCAVCSHTLAWALR